MNGWPRLLLGLALVYLLFQWLATALGSNFGQAGLVIGVLVVAATLLVEQVLFGQLLPDAARALGLGRPAARGILVAIGISAALLLVFPVFAAATGTRLRVDERWPALVPGLFAQAGV